MGTIEGAVPLIKRSLVLLIVFVTLVACDNTTYDCFSCKCNPDYCRPVSPTFQDLTQRSHVLNNFALAHNKRDMTRYDELLDNNYTFSFDTVNNGSVVTIQWGRPDEITATGGLFNAVDKMDFALDLASIHWTEMTAPDNSGQTWYTTTVFYHFVIKIGPVTYTPVASAQMSFTVRNAGTTAKAHWQLVELRDDAHISSPPPAKASAMLHTEETTYGRVKSGM